uniref:Uncharacterized protein n=1 Tax=Tetradesmus obliquus TaxID=3088 RepID=A0A383W243_TETOB|eukprot:jgi/Sobl393_1/14997/SZX70726.1
MGPKRRKRGASGQPSKKRRKGLLGAAGYESEEDEDYAPSKPASKPTRARKAKPARRQSEFAWGDEQDSESDTEPDSGRDSSEDAALEAAYASPDGEDTSDDDSSDEDETLAARQARLCQQQSAAAAPSSKGRRKGTAPASRAGAAVAAEQQPATGWDHLPTSVLAKVFLRVCAAGALPMAPRLACVCSSWAAAAAETPELWSVLDTQYLPAAAAGSSRGAGSSRSCPASKRKKAAEQQQRHGYTADEGLASWLAAGRLRQLQELRISCAGSSHLSLEDPVFFEDAEAAAAAAGSGSGTKSNSSLLGGGCAEIGGQVLLLLAQGCPQLRRVTVSGAPSFRAEELSAALLAMPLLAELRLSGLRITPVQGLDAAVRRVLDAAAATGAPALSRLVLESCPMLGKKTLRALCQPSRPAAAAAATAALANAAANVNEQKQEGQAEPHAPAAPATVAGAPAQGVAQQQQQQQQPRAAAPCSSLGPAFPALLELDLSCSCSAIGGGIELHLEGLQAAMPLLRVLKLSGLGGFYGFNATARNAASLPGFPHLHTLHIGCAMLQLPSGLLRSGTSYVTDACLLSMAGKSPNLEDMDISGAHVSQQGLTALAVALWAAGGGSSSKVDAPDPSPSSAAAAAAATAAAGDAADQPEEAKVRGCLPLKRLYINRCSKLACDEGLILIGQLAAGSLQELVVRNAGATVGDDGLRGLLGCSSLTTLDITSSSVTEEGLRELLSALPGLEDLQLGSCRGLSRGARQAAAAGVGQLQRYLRQAATADAPAAAGKRRR